MSNNRTSAATPAQGRKVQGKYKSDEIIREKIMDLFEYRKLHELMRLGGVWNDRAFRQHLVDLQFQIYKLDAYLESQFELDRETLNGFWTEIYRSLQHLGYERRKARQMLKEIRRYERIELDCRRDRWPTRIGMKPFYTTKSCDVRLIRHILYQKAPSLKEFWKEKVWSYYDLITEVNDDIYDLAEDVHTYNGNRFLLSVLRKGSVQTERRYSAFIDKTIRRADLFFKKHPSQERHHELHKWIHQRAKETTELLQATLHGPEWQTATQSNWLPYMS